MVHFSMEQGGIEGSFVSISSPKATPIVFVRLRKISLGLVFYLSLPLRVPQSQLCIEKPKRDKKVWDQFLFVKSKVAVLALQKGPGDHVTPKNKWFGVKTPQ